MAATYWEDEPTTTSDGSPLERFPRRFPDLYGKLLETNQAIEDTTVRWILIYLLVLLPAGYATLWFDWHRQLWAAPMPRADVASYVLLTVGSIFLMVTHIGWLRRGRYRRHRDELLALIRKNSLSRHGLLAILQQDRAVADVLTALKRDRWDSVG